jgi:hypothetical protein
MGLFGALAGLFTASKVHDAIDKDHDDSFIEDAFETEVSRGAGGIVGDVVDSLLGDDDREEDEDSDDDY